jgi:hypothetical protein
MHVMHPAIIAIAQPTDKTLFMEIIYEDSYSNSYEEIVKVKFNFLKDFFGFDPNTISPYKISIKILSSLEEFENKFFELNGYKPAPNYVVGFTGSGGRVYVLDKAFFSLKRHKEEEFENVLLHELSHIFLRRFMDGRKVSVWIEEGLCEFLSFRNYPLKIKNFINFKEIENVSGWRKYYPYQQARAFFIFIEIRYGKDKIREFVNDIKKVGEKEAINKLFGDREKFNRDFMSYLKNEKIISSWKTL